MLMAMARVAPISHGHASSVSRISRRVVFPTRNWKHMSDRLYLNGEKYWGVPRFAENIMISP